MERISEISVERENKIYRERNLMRKKLTKLSVLYLLLSVASFIIFSSCNSGENSLAPYESSVQMSDIRVEDSSFTPKITWVGGYVSVVGVNSGSHAGLDSSLIWLIYMPDDMIHYPIKFGTTPSGAQDLTAQYHGSRQDSLIEDSTYTFWVMKAAEWSQISAMQNKIIILDSSLTSPVVVNGDTARFSPQGHTQKTRLLDNYINIRNYAWLGRLGIVKVEQPTSSNNPRISWEITQDGVTDTLVAAVGIVEGQAYNFSSIVWEVYSTSDSAGITYYGKKNVISSPLLPGQEFPETFVFTEYPSGGLKRNTEYYVWIANKNWDGENRQRFTPYYAYATFSTY